jgi:hypothetical protein
MMSPIAFIHLATHGHHSARCFRSRPIIMKSIMPGPIIPGPIFRKPIDPDQLPHTVALLLARRRVPTDGGDELTTITKWIERAIVRRERASLRTAFCRLTRGLASDKRVL